VAANRARVPGSMMPAIKMEVSCLCKPSRCVDFSRFISKHLGFMFIGMPLNKGHDFAFSRNCVPPF
jgi:hypothetical protein